MQRRGPITRDGSHTQAHRFHHYQGQAICYRYGKETSICIALGNSGNCQLQLRFGTGERRGRVYHPEEAVADK